MQEERLGDPETVGITTHRNFWKFSHKDTAPHPTRLRSVSVRKYYLSYSQALLKKDTGSLENATNIVTRLDNQGKTIHSWQV